MPCAARPPSLVEPLRGSPSACMSSYRVCINIHAHAYRCVRIDACVYIYMHMRIDVCI